MRSWLLLCACLPAEPHAFWLTIGEENTFVRFSENPSATTVPGFDQPLANRTGVFVAVKPATAVKQLALAMGTEGGFHNLVAPTPSSLRDPTAVAMVEGEGLKGMFEEFPDTLIRFWFSAPLTKERADWDYIDQHSTNRLLVSLRPAAAGAACATSRSSTTFAEVVVIFAGKPLPGNVSVDLHTSSGATVGTVFAIDGIAKVNMPTNKVAFARTRHTEPSPPHIDPVTGGTYHKIMHVATTTTNGFYRMSCYGAAVEEA